MFLVLVVHADFFSLGVPTAKEIAESSLSSFTRLLFESISIGCVDMFVLLSGWFGIRPRLSKFCAFLFQCAFFLFGIYAVCLLFHLSDFSLKGIAGCFLALKWNWFVKAYILLYIISPILNAYVESATKKQFGLTIICFYIFQTFYSWLTNASEFFVQGYSTISFIGLYLLSRYCAKYTPLFVTLNKNVYLVVYIAISLLLAVIYFALGMSGLKFGKHLVFRYDSPLVVMASLSLLLYFSKLKLKSKMINWIAASSFAVYLLHANPNLGKPFFVPMVQDIYHSNNGIMCILYLTAFLLLVYCVSIFLDQIRKKVWSGIEPKLFKNKPLCLS